MATLDLPPLPAADHERRQHALRERLEAAELAAMVVTTPANVRWLTGFAGSYGQVLVTPDAVTLVTDGRYEERAATEAPTADVATDPDWRGVVAREAPRLGVDRVAFEPHGLTYATGRQLVDALSEQDVEAVPAEDLVEELRAVKDAHELAALEAACAITDAAFEAFLDAVAPGRTERELARVLERTMEDLGAETRAFDSIVAAGLHGAIPHHQPSDRPLARGDLLTVDFGARYAGYHADMTRTVAIGAPADAGLADVHDLVRGAQQAGVDAATPGATVGAVDAACRDRITAAGQGDRFLHPTGHGVGLVIHEAPWVRPEGSGRLQPGTVITVEPGVYLPGRGGVRIEDTVVVSADGSPRRLTTSPRDLLRL